MVLTTKQTIKQTTPQFNRPTQTSHSLTRTSCLSWWLSHSLRPQLVLLSRGLSLGMLSLCAVPEFMLSSFPSCRSLDSTGISDSERSPRAHYVAGTVPGPCANSRNPSHLLHEVTARLHPHVFLAPVWNSLFRRWTRLPPSGSPPPRPGILPPAPARGRGALGAPALGGCWLTPLHPLTAEEITQDEKSL